MPTYTLRKLSSDEVWTVNIPYEELKLILEDDDIVKELSTPKIVTGVGSLHSKVPDGFKDKLKRIKKGSGKGDTIKV